MITAALLVLTLVKQQGAPQPATPIATFTMAGQKVEIHLPKDPVRAQDQDLADVEFEGYKYQFNANGDLVGRYRSTGGWADIEARFREASAKWTKDTPGWRVKAFIIPWTDILDRGADGLIRQRRVFLSDEAIARLEQGLGRMAVAFDAAAAGSARMALDVDLDRDTWMTEAGAGKKPFDDAFDYLGARVNGPGFVDDDRIFRGPYDGLYILHSGLTQGSKRAIDYKGTPLSILAIPSFAPTPNDDSVETMMLAACAGQIALAARKHRFEVATPFQVATASEAVDHIQGLIEGIGGLRPPKTLPTADDLRKRLATRQVPPDLLPPPAFFGKLPRNTTLPAPNMGFEPQIKVTEGPSRSVLVQPPYAAFFASHVDPKFNPRLTGYLTGTGDYGADNVLVYSIDASGVHHVADLLKTSITLPKAPDEGLPPTLAKPRFHGSPNFKITSETDPEHGDVTTISETATVRRGWIWTTIPTIDAKATPILSFWVKTNTHEPMVVTVGAHIAAGVILGRADAAPPEQEGAGPVVFVAPIVPNGTWQRVQIDLRKLPAGISLNVLGIGAPYYSGFHERSNPAEAIIYSFADFKVMAKAEGEVAGSQQAAANLDSEDPVERARYALTAASPELIALLKDRSDLVRINAAARFSRIPEPLAIPDLTLLAQSRNPRVAQIAIEALAAQKTSAAKAGIRKALDDGPFDWNRAFAAQALAGDKNSELAGSISTLFAAKGWRARVEGARALAKLEGEQSMAILTSFLLNADPQVRLAVVELGDISTEIIQRRILYTAVNDPSDAVRAASYIRLLDGPTPALREEGKKGVRDDGVRVRAIVVKALGDRKRPEDRGAILQGLGDADPSVRIAALDALRAIPGPVELAELAPVEKEEYPTVQAALILLAKEKKLALSPATMELLKKSADPEVASAADELGLSGEIGLSGKKTKSLAVVLCSKRCGTTHT